jgi:kynurenine formamidase
MRIAAVFCAGAVAVGGFGCDGAAAVDPPPMVVDLSHALAPDDPTWDGIPTYSRTALSTIAKDGYASGRFATGEHFGTHVDAPAHFVAGGVTVDQLPPDRLDGVRHFPGISVEAATLLAKERHFDTPSIDYGPAAGFEAHHVTMAAGLFHVENAANSGTLPPSGFTVIVAPVKVAGGSGAPARVFALVPKSKYR